MTRHAVALAVAVFAWGAFLMARDAAQDGPPPTTPEVREITLTGCLVEGTEHSVHILDNAVTRPDAERIPRTFRLVRGDERLDFTLHENHQVQVTGKAEVTAPADAPPAGPPPSGRVDPRDLPAFTVTSIQSVSERCLTI
jgi:hypothetical protein